MKVIRASELYNWLQSNKDENGMVNVDELSKYLIESNNRVDSNIEYIVHRLSYRPRRPLPAWGWGVVWLLANGGQEAVPFHAESFIDAILKNPEFLQVLDQERNNAR